MVVKVGSVIFCGSDRKTRSLLTDTISMDYVALLFLNLICYMTIFITFSTTDVNHKDKQVKIALSITKFDVWYLSDLQTCSCICFSRKMYVLEGINISVITCVIT